MNDQMPFPMQRGDAFGRFGEMHNGGASPLDWVIFALLLFLVMLVLAQLVTTFARTRGSGGWGRRRKSPGSPGDPLELARLRYARGEIDRDTYVQLTQDLGGEPEPPAAPASA